MTTSWYVSNICLEGGIYVVAKIIVHLDWEPHVMTPFFFKLKYSLKDPFFFIVLTIMTPIFLKLSSLKTPFFLYF